MYVTPDLCHFSTVWYAIILYSDSDKPSYAYQMVRTDSKEQKLDAFVVPKSLQLTAVPSTSTVGRTLSMNREQSGEFEEGKVGREVMSHEREGGKVGGVVEEERGEASMEGESEETVSQDVVPSSRNESSCSGMEGGEGGVGLSAVSSSARPTTSSGR